jgi:hypothetical protein
LPELQPLWSQWFAKAAKSAALYTSPVRIEGLRSSRNAAEKRKKSRRAAHIDELTVTDLFIFFTLLKVKNYG